MADGAYWFDPRAGAFVSSTYYFAELPSWVRDFNQSQPAAKYMGREWMGHKMTKNDDLDASPFGNELIQNFALAALAIGIPRQESGQDRPAVCQLFFQ